jgi:glycine cleavage system protein P-like pyridoxal-binding family
VVLALRLGTTPTKNPQESSSPLAASSVGAPAPAKRVFTQGDQASETSEPSTLQHYNDLCQARNQLVVALNPVASSTFKRESILRTKDDPRIKKALLSQ